MKRKWNMPGDLFLTGVMFACTNPWSKSGMVECYSRKHLIGNIEIKHTNTRKKATPPMLGLMHTSSIILPPGVCHGRGMPPLLGQDGGTAG